MAYFSQERKAEKAPLIKAILKKYGLKGSMSVYNNSTFVVTISQGNIDFIGNYNEVLKTSRRHLLEMYGKSELANDYIQVNTNWFHEHFDGIAKECLNELIDAMGIGNHNNSDIMTDYFDVGWYVDINIGKWNKPYILVK